MVLKFPAAGSTQEVPVYEMPVKNGETDAEYAEKIGLYEERKDIVAIVRLMKRPIVHEWYERARAIEAQEQKRRKALLDAGDETHKEYTAEGLRDRIAFNRDVIAGCLVALKGVIYGDVDLGAPGVPIETLVEACENTNLLGLVSSACQVGQHPKPKQLEHSGS